MDRKQKSIAIRTVRGETGSLPMKRIDVARSPPEDRRSSYFNKHSDLRPSLAGVIELSPVKPLF